MVVAGAKAWSMRAESMISDNNKKTEWFKKENEEETSIYLPVPVLIKFFLIEETKKLQWP